jgi:hypothetical protein
MYWIETSTKERVEFRTSNKETVFKMYKIMAVPLWELEFTETDWKNNNWDSRGDTFEVSCSVHFIDIKQIKKNERTV